METVPEGTAVEELVILTENIELQEMSPEMSGTSVSTFPPKERKVSVRFKSTAESILASSSEPSVTALTYAENLQQQEQKIELVTEVTAEKNEDEEEKETEKEQPAKSANLSGILRKVGSSLMGRPTGAMKPAPPGGNSPFVSTFVTGRAESTSTLERFIFNLVIVCALLLLMLLFLGGRFLWYRYVDWI